MQTQLLVSQKIKAVLLLLLLVTTSCDRTHFRQIANNSETGLTTTPDIPVDPVDPVDPPVVTPPPPVITPPPPPPPPVVTPPPVINPPPVVLPPPVVTPPPPPKPPVVTPPPVINPPPVVLPPIPKPVQKAGACAPDSSTQLLSCLNCVVPMNPPPPPQFSEKGKALIDVMTIGCSMQKKGTPKGYVPPTQAELIARLNRLSPKFYPDSTMSAGQKNVITGILNDPKMQQKIFGGLWYNPPYSDYFETYFGASVGELIYQICYQSPDSNFTPDGTTPLQSKEYIDCQYSENSFNCKEKAEYIAANQYRDQLREGMKESIRNPYVPPPPTPAKNCNWESYEGDYDLGGESVLTKWLNSGFKIGIELSTLAGKCEPVTTLPTGSFKPRGNVKMSGYICK